MGGTWGAFAPLGSVSLWDAPPKTGKTTLLRHVLDSSTGSADPVPILGMPVLRTGAVVLSEESAARSVLATLGASERPAPVPVKAGSGTLRSVQLLPWHLAQALWLADTCQTLTGLPYRALVLDSLFHWVPEAETDTRAAKAAMAALRALATWPGEDLRRPGPGYAVHVLAHSDPDTGRLKGPQQTWAQADYRISITPVPRSARPEDTDRRRAHFAGRFVPPESRPPDLDYTGLPDGTITSDTGRQATARTTTQSPVRETAPAPEPSTVSHREISPHDVKRKRSEVRVWAALVALGAESAPVPAALVAERLAAEVPKLPRSTVYRAMADLAAPDRDRLTVKPGTAGQKSYAVNPHPKPIVTA